METIKLNKTVARKVLGVAVNHVLGLPIEDNTQSVGRAVVGLQTSLNDSYWPKDSDRIKSMRKLAIAQLGSDTLNQDEFTERVLYKCLTKVAPLVVENALKEDKNNEFLKRLVDTTKIAEVVKKLKKAKTLREAKDGAEEVYKLYCPYTSTYMNTHASASVYAFTYASSYAYAWVSPHVHASVYTYAQKNPTFSLKVLNLIAKAGLDTLIEMKSPGVKWLDLCNK